jgi:hypothetical protein
MVKDELDGCGKNKLRLNFGAIPQHVTGTEKRHKKSTWAVGVPAKM